MSRLPLFLVVTLLLASVPLTASLASAEGFASGAFPERTFSVTRSPPGGPRTDTLTADVLPTRTGEWWVTAETIAGSKVIVEVWRNDEGALVLENSSKLRAAGDESNRTVLMAGRKYAASFTPLGKPGTSILREHFMPSTRLPPTVYVWTMSTTSQNIMIASLAGIVNRNTDGELLLSPIYNRLPHPVFWLNELMAAYPEVQAQFSRNPTFFINRYRTMLSGYVLYDRAVNPDSMNMANSIAGVTNAIIVDPATLSYAAAAGLPLIADARTMTYSQVYTEYGAQFNKDMLFHQEARDDTLRDYAILNEGFVYYTDPTALNPYAANQNHQGRIYGWGPSEFDLFLQASQSNQQVVASDHSWSASTTSKWKVPLARQQYHAPANVATKIGKHYVAFVMPDGDNVAWLTGDSATNPKWFGSPYRGNFNMTWEFSPTLGEMNPLAFNYYYQHASNGAYKDNFVSAGGAGITFPSQYPDINGLATSISQSMHAADHEVITVSDPSYDTSKLYPILEDPQVMGMMFKTYCCYYKGRDGALEFYKGKPILSVKYSLWDGADTALSIADALNNDPHRDGIHDPTSYSIVNVHPWSTSGPDGTGYGTPMGNLNQLVQWLDSSKVEVITLEELMVHLRNNFGTPLDRPNVYDPEQPDADQDGIANVMMRVLTPKATGSAIPDSPPALAASTAARVYGIPIRRARTAI